MNVAPLVALGLIVASAPVSAQRGLADPTRPPMIAPAPAASAPQSEAPASELQSILISPNRKIAVINGETVAVGEKLGDATLVRVTETEAVLEKGSETRVLKLYPSVVKRPQRAAASQGAMGERRQ